MTRTYIGRRHDGRGRVEVLTPGGPIPLPSGPQGFSWGGDDPRSTSLARALLADVLGAEPPTGLAVVFTADVIERLPGAGFELEERAVRAWLDEGAPRRMTPDELVEHLGAIALAPDDEEEAQLDALVARCWSPRALAN